MFFRKKRLEQESFKLELPEFKELKPIDLKDLSKKTDIPKIKRTSIYKKNELKVPEFKKPELKPESNPKKDISLRKLKKLDKGLKSNLVDLKRKTKEHERGFKLVSGHMKDQSGKIGELNKTATDLLKEVKNLKSKAVTVSTFDGFSRNIRTRLDTLDRLNKEISRKVALVKDIKTKIDEKYSLNLQITNQMKERMIELKKGSNNDNQIVQENLNNMMKFIKDLSTSFNNSVSIREEIKRRLVEHDKKIRELISTSEKPLDIEEYLRRAESGK
ncbi:hypothetical protein CL621_00625 [archaeon]|nr:hypothetical protein [archaeon]